MLGLRDLFKMHDKRSGDVERASPAGDALTPMCTPEHTIKIKSVNHQSLDTLFDQERWIEERDEFVTRSERTFKSRYVPAFSELKFAAEERFDFAREFDDVIQLLLDQKLLFTDDQEFRFTQAGLTSFSDPCDWPVS